MRILLLHSDYIVVEPREKALKDAEELKEKKLQAKEALVVFTAIEESDTKKAVENAAKEIEEVYAQVKAERIMLYPWVHLTSKPAAPKKALELLKYLESLLADKYETLRAPFGWYKKFSISVKGHALSELSREITGKEAEEEQEEEKHYNIAEVLFIDENGNVSELTEKHKKILAVSAVLKDELSKEKSNKMPAHIELVKRFAVAGREPVADAGCLRYGPNGAFMFELIRRLAWQNFVEKHNYVYPFVSPTIIDKADSGVRWLVEHFPERHYKVIPGGKVPKAKELFLKTAGDYGVFSMHRDTAYSYRHLPAALYELEVDYRYEQRGELKGLLRLREFHMHNVHAACKDIQQAWKVFNDMWKAIEDIFVALYGGSDIFVLYSERDLWEKFKRDVCKWAKEYKKPVIVFIIENVQVYMGCWIDLVTIDSNNRPIETGTAQLDVRSAEPWNIRFADEEGKKRYATIVHAGFGVERAIASMFEKIAREGKKALPLWLAPVQVRVIPVSEDNLSYAKKVVEELESRNIRAELDDGEATLSKKVREAHLDWIHYIGVVGEKEQKTGKITVLERTTGKKSTMSIENLASEIQKKCKGMPSLKGFAGVLLTKKPKFNV